MVWYLVYEGRGKGRDGKFYRRIFVKKLNLPSTIKPKITKKYRDKVTENVLVNISYSKPQRYRGGVRHLRRRRVTIVLGETARKIRLTTKPPKGPKIDRRR